MKNILTFVFLFTITCKSFGQDVEARYLQLDLNFYENASGSLKEKFESDIYNVFCKKSVGQYKGSLEKMLKKSGSSIGLDLLILIKDYQKLYRGGHSYAYEVSRGSELSQRRIELIEKYHLANEELPKIFISGNSSVGLDKKTVKLILAVLNKFEISRIVNWAYDGGYNPRLAKLYNRYELVQIEEIIKVLNNDLDFWLSCDCEDVNYKGIMDRGTLSVSERIDEFIHGWYNKNKLVQLADYSEQIGLNGVLIDNLTEKEIDLRLQKYFNSIQFTEVQMHLIENQVKITDWSQNRYYETLLLRHDKSDLKQRLEESYSEQFTVNIDFRKIGLSLYTIRTNCTRISESNEKFSRFEDGLATKEVKYKQHFYDCSCQGARLKKIHNNIIQKLNDKGLSIDGGWDKLENSDCELIIRENLDAEVVDHVFWDKKESCGDICNDVVYLHFNANRMLATTTSLSVKGPDGVSIDVDMNQNATLNGYSKCIAGQYQFIYILDPGKSYSESHSGSFYIDGKCDSYTITCLSDSFTIFGENID